MIHAVGGTYLNWRIRSHSELWRSFACSVPRGRTSIIAVDGRSGSGKSTLATALAALHQRCVVVYTDDIAWHHSFFDWSDLLIENVLEPLRTNGTPIAYRPASWIERNRPGSIAVDSGTSVVLLEGVGAARRELRPWLDTVVWVDTDEAEGRARVEARGVDTREFIDDWMREEADFLADHRPWEVADLFVSGDTDVGLLSAGKVLAARGPD